MLNTKPNRSFLYFICCLGLAGCASHTKKSPVMSDVPSSVPRPVSDAQRIAELERQLAERQRQCAEEKRRQELALKESQQRAEQLQKKLDSLLAIDRELRNRPKER